MDEDIMMTITPEGNYRPLVYHSERAKVERRSIELERKGWKRIGGIQTYDFGGSNEQVQIMECSPMQYILSKRMKKEDRTPNDVAVKMLALGLDRYEEE